MKNVANIAGAILILCAPNRVVEGSHWGGPLLKPQPREEVFKFTVQPTFRTIGTDRYEVAFACKGKCDVAVSILSADGKRIRHLAAGVLGANAPEPLRKNSLKQVVCWDGKDDAGEYVERPETCRARVALGLTPRFDKLIGWHPHDMTGKVAGIGADANGVYVLNTSSRQQIKKYDHTGQYTRTVYPWPSDTFNAGAVLGVGRIGTPHGQSCPKVSGLFGGFLSIGSDKSGPIYSSLPVHNGVMLVATRGWRAVKKLMRLGADGTSRGESANGPVVARQASHLHGGNEIAVSPDGRWIYMTALGPRSGDKGWARPGKDGGEGENCRHAVYRLAWNDKGPIGQPFIGEEELSKRARGKDNRHFNFPTGLACDPKGRLYVSDFGNNRIQVFSPKGTYLKTIPCKQPWHLAIHPKTGALYVHSYSNSGGAGFQARILKLGGFDNPRPLKAWAIPNRRELEGKRSTSRPLFCLDAWTAPAKIWVTNCGGVQVYAETKKGFRLALDFGEKVLRDGYTPGCMGPSYRNRLMALPNGHLYFSRGKMAHDLTRVDPAEGKRFERVYKHWAGLFTMDEVVTSKIDELLYCRGIAFVARMRPPTFRLGKKSGRPTGVMFTPDDEVVFDYGEALSLNFSREMADRARAHGEKFRSRSGRAFRGVIRIPSVPGGNYENMGVNVSPNGDVIAFAKVYGKTIEYHDRKELGLNEVGMKRYLAFIKTGPTYQPKQRPGILFGGQLVFTWDRRGELTGENLVSCSPGSCGIAMDKRRNFYVGVGVGPHKPKPFAHGGRSGMVCKFPPTGGRIFGGWGPLPLKKSDRPKRSPDFAGSLWAGNMYWSFPGVGQITCGLSPGCTCPQTRFHVDLYDRSFLPMAWRFCVAVLDGNGNPITYVGRYGNADSGRGPDSPIKIPGGITLAHCSFLDIESDRWLYMNDSGNNRIVRAKLAYATEKVVPLGR